MPPDPSLKQAKCYLTPSQMQAFKQAMARVGKVNQSEVIRDLIEAYCEAQGVEFPHDLPKSGQRRDYLEK